MALDDPETDWDAGHVHVPAGNGGPLGAAPSKTYMARQRAKLANERYRLAAARMYGRDGLAVSHTASVQPVEDGAFVEATVWVPHAEAEREE